MTRPSLFRIKNRPLGYLEDDIQYPPPTPSLLIFGTNITLAEDRVDSDPDFKQNVASEIIKLIRDSKGHTVEKVEAGISTDTS